MIRPDELFVLALEEDFKLKNHEMIQLYESLISEQYCIYRIGRSKNFNYQKIYNKTWFFKKLNTVRSKIKLWTTKHKLKILIFNDEDYPKQFSKLSNPPYGLFIFGELPNFQDTVSVVGRREAKTYTLNWMEDHLAPYLKSKKITVVSGGARGVDSKAHKLALMNNCPTVYVIPSGLLNVYPSNLQNHMHELTTQGAVFMSSYHPESAMEKQNFADRNWLIAALSEKVIILEAEIRSGTYKTAKYAMELDCELGVVPSFPTDQSYSGSLQLLYDGAQMLRDSKDVEAFLNSKSF